MTEEQVRQIVRDELAKFLGDYSNYTIEMRSALEALGFVRLTSSLSTGIVFSNSGQLSVISGQTGSFYAATISGGAVNHQVQVNNGVVTTV